MSVSTLSKIKRHDPEVVKLFKANLGVGHRSLEKVPHDILSTLLWRLNQRQRQLEKKRARQRRWMGTCNEFLDEIEFRDDHIREPDHGIYDEIERRYG